VLFSTTREFCVLSVSGIFAQLRQWARTLKQQVLMLYCALHDPDLPWLPRLIAMLVVAYACSPIDLIPDFIPLLGYLDDVILLPMGIWLVLHLTPADIQQRARVQAAELQQKPVNRRAALVIVLIWLVAAMLLTHWLYRWISA
jgi:uncharacterized membrane protein YkvA (DUF1232 family)